MKEHELPPVSVVIAAHNEEKHIHDSISAIEDMDYPRELIEIILVDSNSSDNTWSIGSKLADKCVKINSPYPTAGESFNAGILVSNHDYVWISGGDIILDANFLRIAISALKENQDVAVVTGYWIEMKKSGFNKTLDNMDLRYRQYKDFFADTPNGGVFRKKVLFALNGYDERIRKGQETELGQRLRDKGWYILKKNHPQGRHDYDIVGFTGMANRYFIQGESSGRLLFNSCGSSSKEFFDNNKKRALKSIMLYTFYIFITVCLFSKLMFFEMFLFVFFIVASYLINNTYKTLKSRLPFAYWRYLNTTSFFSVFAYIGIVKSVFYAFFKWRSNKVHQEDKKGLTEFNFNVIETILKKCGNQSSFDHLN